MAVSTGKKVFIKQLKCTYALVSIPGLIVADKTLPLDSNIA